MMIIYLYIFLGYLSSFISYSLYIVLFFLSFLLSFNQEKRVHPLLFQQEEMNVISVCSNLSTLQFPVCDFAEKRKSTYYITKNVEQALSLKSAFPLYYYSSLRLSFILTIPRSVII
jgi:hypothetical protein